MPEVGSESTLAGAASGSVTLTVHGHWNYDGFDKTLASDPVQLGDPCVLPTTTTVAPTTTTTVATTPTGGLTGTVTFAVSRPSSAAI